MGLRGQFSPPGPDLYRVSAHHRPVQERKGVAGCGRRGSLTWESRQISVSCGQTYDFIYPKGCLFPSVCLEEIAESQNHVTGAFTVPDHSFDEDALPIFDFAAEGIRLVTSTQEPRRCGQSPSRIFRRLPPLRQGQQCHSAPGAQYRAPDTNLVRKPLATENLTVSNTYSS
jgi:hypothetical protein